MRVNNGAGSTICAGSVRDAWHILFHYPVGQRRHRLAVSGHGPFKVALAAHGVRSGVIPSSASASTERYGALAIFGNAGFASSLGPALPFTDGQSDFLQSRLESL